MTVDAKNPIVLSHFQVEPIIAARQAGAAAVETSLDLGITRVEVQFGPEYVSLPGGERLRWPDLSAIQANNTACYIIVDGRPAAIQSFSAESGLYYSLMPTESAPTMLVSGIPMHRIKDTNPYLDTLSKIKAIAPLRGRVLDTATGLGYTAIEAATSALQVVTIEIDPVAQEIARMNPWSRGLFDNPKITLVIGDSFEEIGQFEAGTFAAIIHDPPVFSLAGDLYSGEFYRQAYRVLKPRGRMFHYIGDPHSKSGARTTRGVVQRLREAGFARVEHKPRAFGVLAHK
jgi:predicted methyltransferase